MADVLKQQPIRSVYKDGSIVVSNVKSKIDNGTTSYSVVSTWYDGTPMTDAKVDQWGVYSKYKATGEYLRENKPNWGELFLEVDTVDDLRAMSAYNQFLVQIGYYKGVRLGGYYAKGDTPGVIDYFLSLSAGDDDGISIYHCGAIKLEHNFIEDTIDVKYAGGENNIVNAIRFGNRKNKIIKVNKLCEIGPGLEIDFCKGIVSDIPVDFIIRENTLIKIPDNSDLVLRNIRIKLHGDASQQTENGSNRYPIAIFNQNSILMSPINKRCLIENVSYEFINGNEDGSIRGGTVFSLSGFSSLQILNCDVYKVSIGFLIRYSTNVKLYDNKFVNAETGFDLEEFCNYVDVLSNNLINTPEQSNNWRAKNLGSQVFGKDLIFGRGSNYYLENNNAINPVERVYYIIGVENITANNNRQTNGIGFKVIGNPDGVKCKNVIQNNNILTVDENILNKHQPNVPLIEFHSIDGGVLSGNRAVLAGGLIGDTRNIIQGITTAAYGSKNLVISGNHLDDSFLGVVVVNYKTEEEYASSPEPVLQNVKIIGNTGRCLANISGGVMNGRANSSSYLGEQVQNVEIRDNVINANQVFGQGCEFFYTLQGVNGLVGINNKINGVFRYGHAFINAIPTYAENINITETGIEAPDVNNNIIKIRSMPLSDSSSLGYIGSNGHNVMHNFKGALRQIVSFNKMSRQVINSVGRTALITYIGKDATKFISVFNGNADSFLQVEGVLDESKITKSINQPNNIVINNDDLDLDDGFITIELV